MNFKKPYYQDSAVIIYHADCREILQEISADVLLTDPPFGVMGGKGRNKGRKKAVYSGAFPDTQEYLEGVSVPAVTTALSIVKRGAVTPGNRNLWLYPKPTDIGSFNLPYSVALSFWGVQALNMILYYGKDPYPQKMKHTCLVTQETPPKDLGHPCPKPFGAWCWLLERVSLPGEIVLDPFMGSGTTLLAAKTLGRKAVGIEIEEKYCEIAARRMSQEILL